MKSDPSNGKSGIAGWLTPGAVGEQPAHTLRGKLLRVGSVISNAITGFIDNNDLLWAAALTYTITLSIVPILALAFSVLKTFGYSEQLQPLLKNYLAPGSISTADALMDYINNVNAATLGSVGGAFLLITVISTLGAIEQAFNTIFGVSQSRSYLRKFTNYLSVIFTVPLFIVAGLALTAWFSMQWVPIMGITRLAPFIFLWVGFFFLFIFFPYTRVNWRAALFGAAFTAVLFQIAQFAYVHFQVGVSRYQAIYGALATVPAFLVWIYTAWIIILFGAELTAALQRGVPPFILKTRSPDFTRAAALYAMLTMAEQNLHGERPVTYETIARKLNAGTDAIDAVINSLKKGGLVIEDTESLISGDRKIYLSRAPSTITVPDILKTTVLEEHPDVADPRIRAVLTLLQDAADEAVKPMTLADVMNIDKPAPTAPTS